MNSPQSPPPPIEPTSATSSLPADAHPLAPLQERLDQLHDWVATNDRTAMLGAFCAGVLVGFLLRR